MLNKTYIKKLKKVIKIQTLSKADSPQTLIIPLIQDDKLAENLAKIAKQAGVSTEILQADFKADAKESLAIYSAKKTKIMLLGLGKKPSQIDFLKTFRSFFYKQKSKLPAQVGIDLRISHLGENVEQIVNGICLAEYEIDIYKTEKKKEGDFFTNGSLLSLYVADKQVEKAEKAVKNGELTAETQRQILTLVDAPANKKYPQKIAEFAQESGRKHGFSVKVFDEKECETIGLHALLAVGKGSENPPRFILLEYTPASYTQTVGLVGKGVTFDTGGISIKPSGGMSYMKSDMGGAAAVLGTIELAAKLQLPIKLVGVIPSTENCVDGNATKPSNVIDSYSGKTIEVIDTDAEGRLILADGLAYMVKNYHPDIMIDLATLTGNCIAALGYAAAGLLTTNDELANKLLKISQLTGEKLWRLPMWDDYKDMMKSDIADIKNLSSQPVAGAVTAGKFLEFFTENHQTWAHLDIAGTAFGDSEFASMKSATAFGIRLLTTWLREI